jgi:hypothetical protein
MLYQPGASPQDYNWSAAPGCYESCAFGAKQIRQRRNQISLAYWGAAVLRRLGKAVAVSTDWERKQKRRNTGTLQTALPYEVASDTPGGRLKIPAHVQ